MFIANPGFIVHLTMKNTLFSLAFLACGSALAQSNSRITFIYYSKEAAPDAVLFHNNQPTDTLHPNTALIKEGTHLKGTWAMRPVSAPANTRMVDLKLSVIDNKALYIQFIPGRESAAQVWPYVLSTGQFHQMFRKEKWLKEQIRTAGYHKPEDLLNGYSPYIFPQPEDVPYVRKQQPAHPGDSIFYDYFSDVTCRDSAWCYCIPSTKNANGLFPYSKYRMETNTLYCTGYFTDLDSLNKTGEVKMYFISGRKLGNGTYLNGEKNGAWQYFYDTAGSPVWYTENYTLGKSDGPLKSYYKNGQLKRTENHMPFTIPAKSPGGLDYYIDSITTGQCYNEEGKEIAFTPFNKMPVCTIDVQGYLASTVRYPEDAREAGKQGRAVIKFMVTDKGRVYYPKVSRSVCQSIDIEAWRTIYNMPDWLPGLKDGEPIDAIFNQPISFRLE
jgi:TonB family protein